MAYPMPGQEGDRFALQSAQGDGGAWFTKRRVHFDGLDVLKIFKFIQTGAADYG